MGLGLLGDFEVWVWLWLVKLFQGWKEGLAGEFRRKFIPWGGGFWLSVSLACYCFFSSYPPRALIITSSPSFSLFPSSLPLICTETHTHTESTCWLKGSPSAQTHIQYTHTTAPVNHLSPGSSSRKPQRGSCWQEAAVLHLSVKVSRNTMWLSSAPSSLLTSLLTLTCPLQPCCAHFLLPLSSQLLPILLWCRKKISSCILHPNRNWTKTPLHTRFPLNYWGNF